MTCGALLWYIQTRGGDRRMKERIEIPEIDPNAYGDLMHDKDAF